MKVLWLSRHSPAKVQIDELIRLFGPDTEVVVDRNAFVNETDIAARFKSGGFSEIVVVAPLTVINKLCERGLRPLYAKLRPAKEGEIADFFYRKPIKFIRFVRVKSVRMETEEV